MSQPIETGNYNIFWFAFTTPSEPVVRRPVGIQLLAGHAGPQVVVLPEEDAPQAWHIQKIEGDDRRYTMRLIDQGLTARPEGGSVHVDNLIPPFVWHIMRSAPHPPPIGNEAVIIGVGPILEDRWLVELIEENQAAVPVITGGLGTNFQLVKLWE